MASYRQVGRSPKNFCDWGAVYASLPATKRSFAKPLREWRNNTTMSPLWGITHWWKYSDKLSLFYPSRNSSPHNIYRHSLDCYQSKRIHLLWKYQQNVYSSTSKWYVPPRCCYSSELPVMAHDYFHDLFQCFKSPLKRSSFLLMFRGLVIPGRIQWDTHLVVVWLCSVSNRNLSQMSRASTF